MADRLMIEAVGLRKHFGDTEAVAGVHLEASEGRILAVLGPNGAGKSTTVRMLTTMTVRMPGGAASAGSTSSLTRRPSVASSASPGRTPASTSCSPAPRT